MSLRIKAELAAALVVILMLAIIGGSWLGAREEGIRLKATLDAQNGVIAAAGKREAERESALKESLVQLEDLKNRTQSPQEVIKQLPAVLPLPQPITLNLPAAVAQGDPSRAGVQPGQSATIPAADLKPLFDYAATCRECQAKLQVLQQDRVDDAIKVAALVRERDAAVTAAKGGSKWSRIKRAGKWFLIGAVAGAVALKASGH